MAQKLCMCILSMLRKKEIDTKKKEKNKPCPSTIQAPPHPNKIIKKDSTFYCILLHKCPVIIVGAEPFYKLARLTLPALMRSQIAFILCHRIFFCLAVDIASVFGTMTSNLFQNYLSSLISCRVIQSAVYFEKGWGPCLFTTGRCFDYRLANITFSLLKVIESDF